MFGTTYAVWYGQPDSLNLCDCEEVQDRCPLHTDRNMVGGKTAVYDVNGRKPQLFWLMREVFF